MRKHQADTAIAVYHQDIVPTLTERQKFVIDGLKNYVAFVHRDPTALELLRYLQSGYTPSLFLDVNSVRPRLTELELAGRVEKADRRICSISRKRVWTWRLRRPDRLF